MNNENGQSIIKVIGVGGGGGNAVEHMINSGIKNVDFICANTDNQALQGSSAKNLILLGKSGLGAGGKPEKGREAAELATSEIEKKLEGAQIVFITTGMGGGTGTGAAPVIARIARKKEILTVAVVTKPFSWEGKLRARYADEGLAELEQNVDSLVIILNDKLSEVFDDDILQDDAFAHANNVLRDAVAGVSDIIYHNGPVNVDFEDIRTIMEAPGRAMLGTAIAGGKDREITVAETVLACPLLDGINFKDAQGVLVIISSKKGGITLKETQTINEIIQAQIDNIDVVSKFGNFYDESLEDNLKVTVLITGIPLNSLKEEQRPKINVISGNSDVRKTSFPNVFQKPKVASNNDIERPTYLRNRQN